LQQVKVEATSQPLEEGTVHSVLNLKTTSVAFGEN